MGTVASEAERQQDRVAKRSGDGDVQDAYARCVCLGQFAVEKTRRSDAAVDLHFLGCPFSPRLLMETCTFSGVLSARGCLLK